MKAEFEVGGAVAKCGVRSEAMKALDTAMLYNYELWLTHYMMHLDQIETLHNIGDPTKLSRMEMHELCPSVDAYNAQHYEIANLAPQDLVEDCEVHRSYTQFSWGN